MSEQTLIAVKHLSRYYGGLCAVNNISFEVKRGQILGFLGANGAGKSTTMQMLAGALAPTTGEITIAGYDLLDHPLQAKSAVGYLPEQPPLYKDMLVEEYLTFCARLHHIPRKEIDEAVDRAIELCGLESVYQRLIGNLSKGFQQRVGIAQAIIHSPAVVILDEPTVGLDPIQMREIRHLITELGQEHSVILSTHILPEVQAVCNQVQIIHQGQLLFSDTIEGLFAQIKGQSLQIGLHRPPTLSTFKHIMGVEEVEQIDDNHVRIWHQPETNPAEDIVIKSVAGNWGLFELIPEQQSLEQIFVNLTTEEELEEAA
ncbi:ATP-binding cassette domain-containing protein [Candidatus Albibeggiatoa sp. nov. NOAA]|uniref:ABC transporter ATP-binding protein n=1 Tax=Candidatus Albibeggiatoa sp. nov. NOAA TaxID=3162724 RepID=UPI0033004FB1|nr:ABC transporter ATP-binding protein [Thiotrichaceae bacterium]